MTWRAAGWAPLLRGENLGPALSALPEDYGLDVEGEQPKDGNKVCWLKLRGAGVTGGRRAWLEEQETAVTLHMSYADRPEIQVSLPVYDLATALEGAATFLRGRP